MSGFLPDRCNREPSVILCPRCFRKTYYALNTDRYVCPAHGPCVVSEQLPQMVRP